MTTEHSAIGTDDARGLPWRALRVLSNREKTVERYLGYEGVDTFLPIYRDASRWSDRVKTIERRLFPGYLFARADDVSALLQVSGVCGVLGGNLTPAVVSDSELESVRVVIASMLPVSPVEYCGSLHPGDLVTVRSGALKGVSGRIVKHSKALRLVVSIEMLGRSCAVELDGPTLEKLAA